MYVFELNQLKPLVNNCKQQIYSLNNCFYRQLKIKKSCFRVKPGVYILYTMSLLQEAKKIVHSVPQIEGTLAILAGGGVCAFEGILGGTGLKIWTFKCLYYTFSKICSVFRPMDLKYHRIPFFQVKKRKKRHFLVKEQTIWLK